MQWFPVFPHPRSHSLGQNFTHIVMDCILRCRSSNRRERILVHCLPGNGSREGLEPACSWLSKTGSSILPLRKRPFTCSATGSELHVPTLKRGLFVWVGISNEVNAPGTDSLASFCLANMQTPVAVIDVLTGYIRLRRRLENKSLCGVD